MKRIPLLCLLLLLCSACSAGPKNYRLQVVAEYPHSTSSYTQGLFFDGGRLFESTGQYGQSAFYELDLESGQALREIRFADKYFCEGSVMLGGKLYILTWTNGLAFVYDAETLEYEKSYSYSHEGWGLTTDGKSLITSDGTSRIYFLDGDLQLERSINVRYNGRALRYLNELEWIDGKIWANVYTSDQIAIINPKDGKVEGIIDCSGLLPQALKGPETDVLNGIAYDPSTGKIYLTGKNWPRLYEVRLVRK